jgi:hypothetical protein
VQRPGVVRLEDHPERNADRADEGRLGGSRGEEGIAAAAPDECIDEQDVAGPGDRRVPGPERLDPEKEAGLGNQDDSKAGQAVEREALVIQVPTASSW